MLGKSQIQDQKIHFRIILLPVILGVVFLGLGIGGIYLSKKSVEEWDSFNVNVLTPNRSIQNLTLLLKDLQSELFKLREMNSEERKTSLEQFRTEMKRTDLLVTGLYKQHVANSSSQKLASMLKDWVLHYQSFSKWSALHITSRSVSPAKGAFERALKVVAELDKEILKLNDRIQMDTINLIDESKIFATKMSILLIGLLILGAILAAISLYLILKSIWSLSFQISSSKKHVENILNNLSEGFFVFDREGNIQPEVSKAVKKFFEKNPLESNVNELFEMKDYKKEQIKSWLKMLFDGVLNFDSMIGLGPREFKNHLGRDIRLDFRPIFENEILENVICISKDVTKEKDLEEKVRLDRSEIEMMKLIILEKNHYVDYLNETKVQIQRVKKDTYSLRSGSEKGECEILLSLMRDAHTIKGTSAQFKMEELVPLSSELEDRIKNLSHNFTLEQISKFQEFVQVNNAMMDNVINKFIESRGDLLDLENGVPVKKIDISFSKAKKLESFVKAEVGIKSPIYKRIIEDLFTVPIGKKFEKYHDLVINLSKKTGKNVRWEITGAHHKVYTFFYGEFFNSLVHLFRNIMDHGIETSLERKETGKSTTALVKVDNILEGNQLIITIADDGRGINEELIKQKALGRGILSEDQALNINRDQLIDLIFHEGFSTSDKVNNLSGRGVGMNVIKEEINNLNGKIEILTKVGTGTCFKIILPFESIPYREKDTKEAA